MLCVSMCVSTSSQVMETSREPPVEDKVVYRMNYWPGCVFTEIQKQWEKYYHVKGETSWDNLCVCCFNLRATVSGKKNVIK